MLLCIEGVALAQTFHLVDSLKTLITRDGFENVRSTIDDDEVVVAFENRRYRFQPRGLAEVFEIISESGFAGDDTKMTLILLHQDIPMLLASITKREYTRCKSDSSSSGYQSYDLFVSLDYQDKWAKISDQKAGNSSLYKSDFVVIPQFRALFGNFDRPVQANINLIPELNLILAKGLKLKSQLIIPLYNNYYFDEEGKEIRPGILTLNHFARLKDDFFVATSVGFFDKNRAGLNFEMKKAMAGGKFIAGTEIGFTTDYTFTGIETNYLDDQNYLTALLTAEYRYDEYNLSGRLQAGNFLYNKLGMRVDIFRLFREISIGFFALVTEDVINGGFNFAIPIPPRKYTKPGFVRVVPATSFTWEYAAKGFPTSGTICKTGLDADEILLQYNPEYIKKFLFEEIKK